MRVSTVPAGVYVPQYPAGRGAQITATIASTSPGLRYGNQSGSTMGVADVTFQSTGSLRDLRIGRYDLRGYRGNGGSLNINLPGRGFGTIGYLGNPFNNYPNLNNPYTYPYGVSPIIQAYYRGAPGECGAYGSAPGECGAYGGTYGGAYGPNGYYGSALGGCGPCIGGACGAYNGPNYYPR